MFLQNPWVAESFVELHFSHSFFKAVMFVSQSGFFHKAVLYSQFFEDRLGKSLSPDLFECLFS